MRTIATLDEGGTYELIINAGETLELQFFRNDGADTPAAVPFEAGTTARMKLRRTHAASTVFADWTAYLTVEIANALVRLKVPASVTASLTTPGREADGVYDIELAWTESAVERVERFVQGTWTLKPEATR